MEKARKSSAQTSQTLEKPRCAAVRADQMHAKTNTTSVSVELLERLAALEWLNLFASGSLPFDENRLLLGFFLLSQFHALQSVDSDRLHADSSPVLGCGELQVRGAGVRLGSRRAAAVHGVRYLLAL